MEDQSDDTNFGLTTMAPNVTDATNATNCYRSPTLEPIPYRSVQSFVFVLYLCTSIVSIVGNVIVILVHVLGRESPRNIRKYLNNLAVSDITMSLMSIPFTYSNIIVGHWSYPHWLCPTSQFFQLLCSFATSTTLTIIGLER